MNIEQDQFVTPQQIMLISHGQDMIEVNAQVSIHDMQILFDSLQVGAKVPLSEAIEHLTAEIILSSGTFKRSWKAKVTRLSDTVNLNQSTVGIILEIPLKNQTSKEMPSKQMTGQSSLVNGMFVEAQITGEARPHWLIPEQALHGDNVYLLKRGCFAHHPCHRAFSPQGTSGGERGF